MPQDEYSCKRQLDLDFITYDLMCDLLLSMHKSPAHPNQTVGDPSEDEERRRLYAPTL